MIVHLDTSALIDAVAGPRRGLDVLVGLIAYLAMFRWGHPLLLGIPLTG